MTGSTATSSWRRGADALRPGPCCWCSWSAASSTRSTFALATSRLTGYQFVFFAIQGPAALASGRLERLARRGGIAGKIAAHGATILFLAATSVLFFDGVSRIFPFIYASRSLLP